MAYFPNGSSAEVLENQCCECINKAPDSVCPVHMVQIVYNYEQCDNEKLKECISRLIDDKGQCKMREAIKKARISITLTTEEIASRDMVDAFFCEFVGGTWLEARAKVEFIAGKIAKLFEPHA